MFHPFTLEKCCISMWPCFISSIYKTVFGCLNGAINTTPTRKTKRFQVFVGRPWEKTKKNRSLPGNKEGWQAWIYMWILVLKEFIYNTLNDRNETLLFTDCKLTQTLASSLTWWSLEIRTVVGKINRTRIIVISNGLNLEACSTVAWENNWHFMMPQFPCKMMSEKQVQKFHTDEASLPDLSTKCFWLAEANFLCGMTN